MYSNQLIEHFYQQFYIQQDYFECHELLEEAWKSNNNHKKDDFLVGLTLYAVSLYHYRQLNFKGALTCIKKASTILSKHPKSLEAFNISPKKMIVQCHQIEHDILTKQQFNHIMLPHLDDQLSHLYPSQITSDQEIILKHKLRDRSDIINLRKQKLNKKNPITDTPND